MVSRENLVIGLSTPLAFPVAFALNEYTAAPTWLWMAVFLLVAVGLPHPRPSLGRRRLKDTYNSLVM